MRLLRLLSLIIFLLTACSPPTPEQVESPNTPTTTNKAAQKSKAREAVEEIPLHPVLRIVDGDTIWVEIENEEAKIRLLGIDTPELERDLTPVECYAEEAEDRLRALLAGKGVMLLKSKTGDEVDRYGRLLRYVFADGEDVSARLIREGYAFAFRRYAHDRRSHYVQLEAEAQAAQVGMWDAQNCSYW